MPSRPETEEETWQREQTLFSNCQASSHEGNPTNDMFGRDAFPQKYTLNLNCGP